jgi:hypothetical protein
MSRQQLEDVGILESQAAVLMLNFFVPLTVVLGGWAYFIRKRREEGMGMDGDLKLNVLGERI